MNSPPDKSKAPKLRVTPTSDSDELGARDEPQKDVPKVSPMLSAYFGTSTVSVSAFFKAIKSKKVARFSDADIDEASRLMVENDSIGARLLALSSQPSLPEAVDRCVWPLVQSRLKGEVPTAFETTETDAISAFHLLYDGLTTSLLSSDKERRQKGETLLRLGLTWLILKRSLDPWIVLEKLKPTYFKDTQAVARSSRRILAHGKFGEIKAASGIAGLALDKVRAAQARRDEEVQRGVLLQAQLDKSQIRARELETALQNSEAEKLRLSDQLAATQRQLAEVQQHAGHDLDATRSQHRLLLVKRILPLLNDAVDALEIVPSAPSIAINRIKTALSTIDEADK